MTCTSVRTNCRQVHELAHLRDSVAAIGSPELVLLGKALRTRRPLIGRVTGVGRQSTASPSCVATAYETQHRCSRYDVRIVTKLF